MKYQKSLFKPLSRRLMLFLTTLAALFLQNCKEPIYQLEDQESYSRIFMQLASNGLNENLFPIRDEWISIPFGAGYGGPIALDKNVQVDFEIADELVNQYNEQYTTNYAVLPTDSYRVNRLSAEIPAGKSGSNSIVIEVNPVKLNGTRAFLLPIRIKNVSADIPVIEDLKTTYFVIQGYYETNPYEPYAQTGWSIFNVSSEASDGPAIRAIDGSFTTHWLSQWARDSNNQRPVHPHHITINMNSTQLVHGLQIFGRRPSGSQTQSSQDYLFPRSVHIETSSDGTTWRSAGVFSMTATPSGAPEATLYFEEAVSCQYFKINVLASGTGNGDTTGLAEIYAF